MTDIVQERGKHKQLKRWETKTDTHTERENENIMDKEKASYPNGM